MLKEWRLYDGNTRSRIAKEPGIIRSGDELSLENQARRYAERFIVNMYSTVDVVRRSRRFQRWGSDPAQDVEPARRVLRLLFDHIENWDNCTNKCSVGIHTVDKHGVVLWANKTELEFLGYEAEEYIGHFIGDFVDMADVDDILGMLTRFEILHNYPARIRAKDGSVKFVIINSNVYRRAGGEFGHSRCFTTEIDLESPQDHGGGASSRLTPEKGGKS